MGEEALGVPALRYRLEKSRELFHGRIFSLTRNDVLLPNGRKSRLDVIIHPGAVVIVPRFDNGDILLVRQFRFAAGEELWELPAGTREAGESPRSTAARELVEETGWRALRLRKLTSFYSAPGFCTEELHLFLASGLKASKANPDADECISVRRMAFDRAVKMTLNGGIRDAKSIAGIHLAGQARHDR